LSVGCVGATRRVALWIYKGDNVFVGVQCIAPLRIPYTLSLWARQRLAPTHAYLLPLRDSAGLSPGFPSCVPNIRVLAHPDRSVFD